MSRTAMGAMGSLTPAQSTRFSRRRTSRTWHGMVGKGIPCFVRQSHAPNIYTQYNPSKNPSENPHPMSSQLRSLVFLLFLPFLYGLPGPTSSFKTASSSIPAQ